MSPACPTPSLTKRKLTGPGTWGPGAPSPSAPSKVDLGMDGGWAVYSLFLFGGLNSCVPPSPSKRRLNSISYPPGHCHTFFLSGPSQPLGLPTAISPPGDQSPGSERNAQAHPYCSLRSQVLRAFPGMPRKGNRGGRNEVP